jgi:hypothetical protein
MIKKYYQFINEAEEAVGETTEKDSSKFTEVKDEIKSMIEETIKKSGGEFVSFVDAFKKNPEDVKVEGFINDSDIYDFYLKWRNDIDEKLNDIKFFDQMPSKNNSFGLYEYIIKGTEKAFKEFVNDLK